MNCFYCKKEILIDTGTQIAFDRPYVNLFVHKECDKLIDDYGVDKYIQDNNVRFLEFVEANKVEFGKLQTSEKKQKSKTLGKPTKKVKRK